MTLRTPKNYQFVEIKTYGSTEWLAANKKKYRSVFDKAEVGYVYCEFKFNNLQFKKGRLAFKIEPKMY